MKLFIKIFFLILFFCGVQNLFGQENTVAKNNDIILSKWQLKSTVLENSDGKEISTGHFKDTSWFKVDVPTTVLNGLVKNGVYPDPRLDMNNYLIPDISDKFNAKFHLSQYSYLPNHENPWKKPYWFVNKFRIPSNEKGKKVWLNFNGINYRGEVWLNGIKITDTSEMVGMFRQYKFNITNAVEFDGNNYLAVKIYPVDHPGTPGSQLKVFGDTRGPDEDIFKDETLKISGGWDCALPVRDRNMGIYRKVYLSFTGDVDIVNPYIQTYLPLPDTTIANLTISATLVNTSSKVQSGLLKGQISLLNTIDMGEYIKHLPGHMNSISFEKIVNIQANDSITVTLSYKDFPQLRIKNPHLWWPNGYGEQYLHNLKLLYVINGAVSTVKNILFGIREVSSQLKELKGDYGRIFFINGKRIFCRGGWIQPDMLLDNNKKNLYDQARLIANANLNVVSSEDMPDPPKDFLDALDKYGLMWWDVFYQCYVTVPGTKDANNPLDHKLAKETVRDIILRYRNSPSIVVWCGANESLPDSDLYFDMKKQINMLDTTRIFLPSTGLWWDWEKLSPYVKADLPVGTTDNGGPDYTWYPLPYYFNMIDDVQNDMFHNECGIPAVPVYSSLKKFIFNLDQDAKSDTLFPLDSVWAEHGAWDGGGYAFKAYDKAIRNYGFKTKNVYDYARIAQMVNADSYRAIYESANSRMWSITSGTMIWKLNSSYPDVSWQVYDWYLNPNAGYYFIQQACEPLHIQMNANDYKVSIINTYNKTFNNFRIKAIVYDFNLKEIWNREEDINIGEDRYVEAFNIPRLQGITPIYFVKLELINKAGKIISSNLYWESSKEPLDFSELSNRKNPKPVLTYTTEETKDEFTIHVKVKNTTDKLSFMNRLTIVRKDNNEEVLPTFWSDNFITLFPGEEKNIDAKFYKKDLNGSAFKVVVDNEK
ncbi:MAG: glycosyl hydrolase 2 galactose-binding domain-containing protein [Ignavibacteriaceae bacterium]